MGMWNMPFQKGNQLAKGHNGGLRREVTVELVSQLNEMLKCKDGVDRTKLHRLVKNLITQATTGGEVVDEKGTVTHEGAGDLQAILAIYDRLEGLSKGAQRRAKARGDSRACLATKRNVEMQRWC